jgi:Pentapeptide repeats (9 copies)/Pentapeptide repeats (8 copies)
VTGRAGGRRGASVAPAAPDVDEDALAPADLPRDLVDAEVREVRLERVAAGGREATGAAFAECVFTGSDLSGAVLRRARLRDTVVRAGSWANADLAETTLGRVAFEGVRLTGATLVGAKVGDASFRGCRLDFASFRFASIERARFEDCRMDEVDLFGTALASVVFESCSLVRATLTEATFGRSEMRGCDLEGAIDPDRLRGVGMPWNDIVRNAPTFAAGIGIRLLDED